MINYDFFSTFKCLRSFCSQRNDVEVTIYNYFKCNEPFSIFNIFVFYIPTLGPSPVTLPYVWFLTLWWCIEFSALKYFFCNSPKGFCDEVHAIVINLVGLSVRPSISLYLKGYIWFFSNFLHNVRAVQY